MARYLPLVEGELMFFPHFPSDKMKNTNKIRARLLASLNLERFASYHPE